jgi:cysteine desulfurase
LIYLDNNATTHLNASVRERMQEVLALSLGNASSPHSGGNVTREVLNTAREQVATLLGADLDQIVFTSGATESNVHSLSHAGPFRNLITTAVEHSSILQTCQHMEKQGVSVCYLPVSSEGLVNVDSVLDMASKSVGPSLVSIQWVNNETGVIQPIEEIGHRLKDLNVTFHIDAAQAVGKIPISFHDLPVDLLSFSGHKLHAPPGVGALLVTDKMTPKPMLFGGAQENGMRAGTENIIGIAGLGAACASRHSNFHEKIYKMKALRDRFECMLGKQLANVEVVAKSAPRVCNTTNLRFKNTRGEALVAQLDLQDLCCSQSSACTSAKPEPSYVLRAMGMSEKEAYECIRFSVSELNTVEEIDTAIECVKETTTRLRSLMSPLPFLQESTI